MVAIIFLIFIFMFVFALSLIEERTKKFNPYLYFALGFVLILYVGLREIGFDNDSESYLYNYNHYTDKYVMTYVEFSFLYLAEFLHNFTDDVHVLFLIYAIIGISIKLFAIRRLSNMWFLPLLVYFGKYFILHDLTQMRASIVSAAFLVAVLYIAKGQKRKAAVIILFSCIFHFSAMALLPAIFLSNNDFSRKEKLLYLLVIPVGYLLHFTSGTILGEIPIPYIGDKLASYQNLRDKGVIGESINVFNLPMIVACFTYYYLFFFYDTVAAKSKYFPIIMRLMGVSLFLYLSLSFMPVLAIRISQLYGITEILYYTYIYYTVRPTWLSKCIVAVIGFSLLAINVFYNELLHVV